LLPHSHCCFPLQYLSLLVKRIRRETSIIPLSGLGRNLISLLPAVPFPSIKTTLSTFTLINGTYQVDGNRLKTYAVEKREQKNGKTVEIKPYSGEVYDAATFSISSDIMMLTYNTFPADAPVSTTAKYQKNLIID
jgi:hypothetical protein